jgi:hypothetical protein
MQPLIFIVFLQSITPSLCWGVDGHKIVAQLAQYQLSDAALTSVRVLLDKRSLSDVATWADEVDHTPAYAWSKCMHYIDSSNEQCSISLESDCASGCCVVAAIGNYTERLASDDFDSRVEALKFLVHFMGDLHQPLHAGNKHDHGGNDIHVKVAFSRQFDSFESNLHSIWDSVMIQKKLHHAHWVKYAGELFGRLIAGDFEYLPILAESCSTSVHAQSCILQAAGESSVKACSAAYVSELGETIKTGDSVSEGYYESRIATIEERLVTAGVRLGRLLNELLSEPESGYIIQSV